MRKFSPPKGRGPRLGTHKKKNQKSLAFMTIDEFKNLRIRPREIAKVRKELDKRKVVYTIERHKKDVTVLMG